MDKERLEEIKADNKRAIAIYDQFAANDCSVLLRAETVYIKELIEAYEELYTKVSNCPLWELGREDPKGE